MAPRLVPRRRLLPRAGVRPASRRGSVVEPQDVRDAAAALTGVAARTPLRYVEPLGAYLKLENLQPIGAFKIRGAYNAIRRLPAAARRGGGMSHSRGHYRPARAY